MQVAAPGPVAAAAALSKLSLPLPQGAATSPSAERAPDRVDLAPPPTAETLRQLAVTGAQHLQVLLPTLERMLQTGVEPMPFALGHLARAVGDAAHQIGAGATDHPGAPGPEPLEKLLANGPNQSPDPWRQSARLSLHDAANLLTQADQRLALEHNPDALWALTQIGAAQRHVGDSIDALRYRRRPEPMAASPSSRSGDGLLGAIALVGTILLLMLGLLVEGLWLAATGLFAASLAVAWVWRIVAATRRFKLEIRR